MVYISTGSVSKLFIHPKTICNVTDGIHVTATTAKQDEVRGAEAKRDKTKDKRHKHFTWLNGMHDEMKETTKLKNTKQIQRDTTWDGWKIYYPCAWVYRCRMYFSFILFVVFCFFLFSRKISGNWLFLGSQNNKQWAPNVMTLKDNSFGFEHQHLYLCALGDCVVLCFDVSLSLVFSSSHLNQPQSKTMS